MTEETVRRETSWILLFTKYCKDEIKNRDFTTVHSKSGKRDMRGKKQEGDRIILKWGIHK